MESLYLSLQKNVSTMLVGRQIARCYDFSNRRPYLTANVIFGKTNLKLQYLIDR